MLVKFVLDVTTGRDIDNLTCSSVTSRLAIIPVLDMPVCARVVNQALGVSAIKYT